MDEESNTNIKLIDFGFAKAIDHNLKYNTVLGTELYMAPEMINKTISGYHNGLSPHKVRVNRSSVVVVVIIVVVGGAFLFFS